MKTWLITSAVTFVPENYNEFLAPLAKDSRIAGLVILDNRHWTLWAKGIALIITGAAPRFGWQLVRNCLFNPVQKKTTLFAQEGKKVCCVRDLNSAECLQLFNDEKPDLILNARTRVFFKNELLSIPTKGCVNIHHGLLPHQRGLMCDFWAHLYDTPAGFSIHAMTGKIDDGALLTAVEVPKGDRNYLAYLRSASRVEANEVSKLLETLEQNQGFPNQENKKSEKTVYFKNPKLLDFFRLRIRGVRL